MTRFVRIASLMRGPIEPAEALDDANQERALVRYEAQQAGLGEIVVWDAGVPMVLPSDSKARGDRLPQVSAALRASLRGRPMDFDDASALQRRRAGIPGRL